MLGMCVESSLCWLGCVSTSRLLGWEIVPVLELSLSPLSGGGAGVTTDH